MLYTKRYKALITKQIHSGFCADNTVYIASQYILMRCTIFKLIFMKAINHSQMLSLLDILADNKTVGENIPSRQ